MSRAVIVLTTVAADRDPLPLARTLVDERLAACVNVLPPMRSIYRWQGAVEQAAERGHPDRPGGVDRSPAALLRPLDQPAGPVAPVRHQPVRHARQSQVRQLHDEGKYLLATEILDKLVSGDIVRESLVIPEGWTATQIGELHLPSLLLGAGTVGLLLALARRPGKRSRSLAP